MNLWLCLKFLVISMKFLVTKVLYFNQLGGKDDIL